MQLYRIIQSMEKEKYITKNKISNIYPGGPQFRLKITIKGISEFSKIDKTGKKEPKNLNDFENGLIEFSDEAKFILQDLINDLFDLFPPKDQINAQEVKRKIISTINSLTSTLSKILS